MWKLLFLFSAVLLAIALFARGWFGKRGLAAVGERVCTVDPATWKEWFGITPPTGDHAADFGRAIRLAALARWQRDDPKAARAREAALRFGTIVPPLTIVILVFAVAVAKLPLFGALAIGLAATALAAAMGLLSIGNELQAVARLLRDVRAKRVFPRAEDEDAVSACAQAAVWLAALPPILGK